MAITINSVTANGDGTASATGTTTPGYRKVAVFCHEGPLDPGNVKTMIDNGQVQAQVVDVNQDGSWTAANAPGAGQVDNVLRVVGIDENNNTLWIASAEFMAGQRRPTSG
jgi:hypothetical protein